MKNNRSNQPTSLGESVTEQVVINWDDYEAAVRDIVKQARTVTSAEVGVLFLTADGIFLEAGYWESVDVTRPAAAQLPTYRLDWWQERDEELGGITAFVAVRNRAVNLNQFGVFNHPAHRGRWDAVFLQGERNRCKGILAVPLKIGERCLGVLKVENPSDPEPDGRFRPNHEAALIHLAETVSKELDARPDFWHQHVRARAMQKVPLLVESLERGRSLDFNLSRGLGFVMKLFAVWLKREHVVHIFWTDRSRQVRCHILGQPEPTKSAEMTTHDAVSHNDANNLVNWLQNRISAEVVQPKVEFPSSLIPVLIPSESVRAARTYVDVIRLKAGTYDLGVVLLPRLERSDESQLSSEEVNELTALAMNFVFTLGKFVEDEYETNSQTYLPDHRRPKVTKTCAILFADIRHFSTLTQMLRLTSTPQAVEPFIDHYCTMTGRAINETPFGRVEKFLGDGAIALFGEYVSDDNNCRKVVAAVSCALSILDGFDMLYRRWMQDGIVHSELPYGAWKDDSKRDSQSPPQPLGDLRRRFNENVEISPAIGINVGEVFLDYFGYN